MPIAREEKEHYSGPKWRRARRYILTRAGGKFDDDGRYLGGARCERCYVCDRRIMLRCGACWWDWELRMWFGVDGQPCEPPPAARCRFVYVVITVAHRNHRAGDDRPSNLAAWCQWCHLSHDKSQHKETRCKHKDARRPLFPRSA